MISSSILIRISAAFAIALLGGALSALLARTHKQLCAFISFGAGTLLGGAICGILPECLQSMSWWQLLLGGASGYFLFAMIGRFVFHVCPACSASHFDEATTHRLGEFALTMMIALAVHCTVDGMAMTAGNEGSKALDGSVTFAICVHKFPEGLALGALLIGGGYRRAQMLWLVAAVESTTILGGFLGWYALQNLPHIWLALALANAGGGFLYLAVHAVLGEIFRHHKTLVLANFAGGFAIVTTLVLYFHIST
jgi:zinc and cadmium transporter